MPYLLSDLIPVLPVSDELYLYKIKQFRFTSKSVFFSVLETSYLILYLIQSNNFILFALRTYFASSVALFTHHFVSTMYLYFFLPISTVAISN